MATLNSDAAVTAAQLGELVDVLESAMITRAQLGDVADALEEALPVLIQREVAASPAARCREPAIYRFQVFRDSEGMISEVLATPEEATPQ